MKIIDNPEKYNSIEDIESSIQNYFPSLKKNGLEWNNAKKIICHASLAYTIESE